MTNDVVHPEVTTAEIDGAYAGRGWTRATLVGWGCHGLHRKVGVRRWSVANRCLDTSNVTYLATRAGHPQ